VNRSLESVNWRHVSSLASYRDAVNFRPERFNPVLVAAGTHMKAVLTCFGQGQFIPVHTPAVDMALLVLEGDGQIVAGDVQEAIHPGAVVFVPAREARGVKARDQTGCAARGKPDADGEGPCHGEAEAGELAMKSSEI
jgi:quercetin dioxygenase-like cupin family protein